MTDKKTKEKRAYYIKLLALGFAIGVLAFSAFYLGAHNICRNSNGIFTGQLADGTTWKCTGIKVIDVVESQGEYYPAINLTEELTNDIRP